VLEAVGLVASLAAASRDKVPREVMGIRKSSRGISAQGYKPDIAVKKERWRRKMAAEAAAKRSLRTICARTYSLRLIRP